jgi:hypothetical protein
MLESMPAHLFHHWRNFSKASRTKDSKGVIP